MKTHNFLIILSLFFTVLSCKKTDDDAASDFKAKKDGEQWISTSSDAIVNKNNNSFLIVGRKIDSKYFQEENLFLSFSLSDKSVVNFSSTWNFVVGGDAISDKYEMDTISINSIRITSLDTINKIISGIFNVKLIRDKYYPASGEMSFTQGSFNLPYQEVWNFE